LADAPTQNPGAVIRNNWLAIAKGTKGNVDEHRTMLVAAGVAFYCLLALFPAITSLLAISGLVVDPDRVLSMLARLEGVVPSQALGIIQDQASEVASGNSGGLGLAAAVGLIIAIYSASKGVGSLIQGMNIAYEETEARGFIALTLTKLALTILIMIGIVLGLVVTLILPVLLSFLPATPFIETIIKVSGWVILLVMTLVGLALLYRIGPSRPSAPFKWVTPGAVVAATVWIVGSAGFAFYVENFGSYNESFGTLAGAVVLLLWLWLSALAVLLGAEMNATTEKRSSQYTRAEQA